MQDLCATLETLFLLFLVKYIAISADQIQISSTGLHYPAKYFWHLTKISNIKEQQISRSKDKNSIWNFSAYQNNLCIFSLTLALNHNGWLDLVYIHEDNSYPWQQEIKQDLTITREFSRIIKHLNAQWETIWRQIDKEYFTSVKKWELHILFKFIIHTVSVDISENYTYLARSRANLRTFDGERRPFFWR